VRRWLVPLVLLMGVALGVSGTILAPGLVGPYLPAAVLGKAELVDGEVVRKQREPDRLLLTILTGQGAVLVTFKQRMAEIDLLVEQGDTLTLALRRYEPFVTDPAIKRVQKPKRAGGLAGDGPVSPSTGEAASKKNAPR